MSHYEPPDHPPQRNFMEGYDLQVSQRERIAALEARCRDYEDMLRRVEGSSRPHYEPAWQYYEIRELLAKYSALETKTVVCGVCNVPMTEHEPGKWHHTGECSETETHVRMPKDQADEVTRAALETKGQQSVPREWWFRVVEERDTYKIQRDAYENRVSWLQSLLREAHDELTDHGHEELTECDCKIARELNFAASDERTPTETKGDPTTPCDHTSGPPGRGVSAINPESGRCELCGNQAAFVTHSDSCPVRRPDFVPIEGVTQCDCDFGKRLAAAIGVSFTLNRGTGSK